MSVESSHLPSDSTVATALPILSLHVFLHLLLLLLNAIIVLNWSDPATPPSQLLGTPISIAAATIAHRRCYTTNAQQINLLFQSKNHTSHYLKLQNNRNILNIVPDLKRASKDLIFLVKYSSIQNNKLFEYALKYQLHHLHVLKRLRELTTADIGKLVSVLGVLTRTIEVCPELLQGIFKCLDCGSVIKNVEQQFKYTELEAEKTWRSLLILIQVT